MARFTQMTSRHGAHTALCVAALAAATAVGEPPARGPADPRAIAEAVIEGCRVREQTEASIEFTVRADRFDAAGGLSFVTGDDAAAFQTAIDLFAGGKRDGATRSRFVERYRLSPEEWEVEAQARLWGWGRSAVRGRREARGGSGR